MLCFWSAKGGAGSSVTSAAAAVLSARDRPTLLVDLGGDLPLVFGLDACGPGVVERLASDAPPPDALRRLEIEVTPQLSLLPMAGAMPPPASIEGAEYRLGVLAKSLAADPRQVIVDVGTCRCQPLLDACTTAVLVTRACYLALSGAARSQVPDGVVVIREPARALRGSDIAAAVRCPVTVTLPWDPAVARAVDSGLFAGRLPRSLHRLRPVLTNF